MAKDTRATYKGDGTRFLNGIPARDLTEADWAGLDTEQRKEVRASDLYGVKTDAEMKPVPAPKPTPPPAPAATPDAPAPTGNNS